MSPKKTQTLEREEVAQAQATNGQTPPELESDTEKIVKVRAEIVKIECLNRDDLPESVQEILDKQLGRLTRSLSQHFKGEREALIEKIEADHPDTGLAYRLVTKTDYEAAQKGRVSDERAAMLMAGAESLGIELAPNEIIVIKKGSGVDTELSQTITEEHVDELIELGDLVVMASRGRVAVGGNKGDLTAYLPGTRFLKRYSKKDEEKVDYEAEIRERDGVRFIQGTKGAKIAGQEFKSLSGVAKAITGYPVRGTQWFQVIVVSQN